MTNEEAIKVLRSLYNVQRLDTLTQEEMTAVAMAIKALETVSCIKEKCAYCPHCENCDVDDETLEIKALEQQTCEDAVNRQAVHSLMATLLSDYLHDEDREKIELIDAEIAELPPVTPKQQPCEDCISRKNMLAVLRQSHSLTQAWDGFEKLPSVTPKEKTGHWEQIQYIRCDGNPGIGNLHCSECNRVAGFEYRYCPNCGARMVSE